MSIWLDKFGVMVFLVALALGGQVMASGASDERKPKKYTKAEKHLEKIRSEKAKAEKLLPPKESDFRVFSSYAELPSGKDQPWRLVRRLQQAQDLIAAGIPGAMENYRAMLLDSSQKMLGYQNHIWSFERNLDAAAIYVLIGGNPEVGKLALQKSYLGNASKSPLQAALAYNGDNFPEAYRMLNAIDPQVLPPSLAGQFALTRAMVTSSRDIALTAKYLKIARKLSPGTLIEEASLRRQLRISGRSKNFKEFKYLSSTYLRRYPNSHFINDFLKAYAYGLVQMPLDVELSALSELQNLLKILDKRQRLFVLAFVARNGTILGKIKLARWASLEALERLKEGSKLHTRMQLYAVASGIVNKDNTEEAAGMLEKIDSDALDISDKKLFDAVSSLSLRLLSEPLDAEQLKSILMNDQQTYPGEDPNMPVEMTKQAKFVQSNDYVTRFDRLAKNYDAVMTGVSK